MSNTPEEKMKHLDEMTLLLYIERQLDRARGLEVSAHTQECDSCRTLLRAMERESRLLTRAMLLEEVWNYKFVPATNLVDVHMGRLRHKVDGPNETPMIHNVRGAGFILRTVP